MTSSAPPAEAPRIAVFAKAPVPGSVKTRLVPLLGAEGAARLHAGLVNQALSTAAATRPAKLQLWCSPDASHPFLAACAKRFACETRTQQGADLGERMAHAFEGNTPLVLIGSDCPALRASHISHAWDALEFHDAVVAPAEDGGYALIALARPCPSLFSDIAWGEPNVMQRTRERLAGAKLSWMELPTLWDVDRPEDYERLRASEMAGEVEA
jgi:rSAM/selenodomain-associated transferase 1